MLADEVKARGLEVDCELVLRMALLHDWAETRVGDMRELPPTILGLTPDRLRRHWPFADIVSGVGPCESDYKTSLPGLRTAQ